MFPARESLLRGIQAGDGKAANLFLQNTCFLILQRRVGFDFIRKFRFKLEKVLLLSLALANKCHVYEELLEDYFQDDRPVN